MYINNNKKRARGKRNEVKKNINVCGVCGDEDGKYKCPKCRLRYCSVKCCKVHKTECQHAKDSNNNKVTSNNDENDGINQETNNERKVIQPVSRYLPSDALTRDPLESAIQQRKILTEEEEEEEEEEGWKITREMMDKLDNSTWLKDELTDGGLRQLIADIDSAGYHHHHDNNDDNHRPSKKIKQWIPRNRNKKNTVPLLNPRETALAHAKLHNQNFATFIDKLLLTAGVVQHVNSDWDTEEILTKLFNGDATMDDVGALRLVPIQKQNYKYDTINANTSDVQSSSDTCESSSEEENTVSGSESDT